MPLNIENLIHTAVFSKDKTAQVIILNTGAVLGPEEQAMLAALHSRSTGGLFHHLEQVAKRGAGGFIKNTYVGYGHKSVGDNGSISIFIEGVSMLVAKAVQDWSLYNGQEVSTRYVDFGKIPFFGPSRTLGARRILEDLRAFYIASMPDVVTSLQGRFPIGDAEKEGIYQKAINARAFDMLRGFLPAGSSTNLAWHTNLRQAADKLLLLHHHVLEEVRDVAAAIQEALEIAHEHSFGHKLYQATESYNHTQMEDDYYHDPKTPAFALLQNNVDVALLPRNILAGRPAKTELPKRLAEAGTMQFGFQLDFASFRDIQRHRAVTQRMPLLTTDLGFHDWYMSELPDSVRKEAEKVLGKNRKGIKTLNLSPEESQYYVPMGYKTSNRLTGSIPALVYLVELRATRFVHPTLRAVAIQMADTLKSELGEHGLVIHLDDEPDRFDVKRGEHDIVMN